MRDFNDQARPPPNHQTELVKLIAGLAQRHSPWKVFGDFVEMGAISLSNAVDLAQREKREGRYLEIVKQYSSDELSRFPQMFGELALALEHSPDDILGRTFHDLELHNRYVGQYFTPYTVCEMMAKMILLAEEDLEAKIATRGYLTAQEPAVGCGAMVIALAQEMKNAGINYQQHLHVTAIDIDPNCVQASYLQFSLLHIPAVVIHGNSLSGEEFCRWYTPAHIMGGWSRKLSTTNENQSHVVQRVPVSEMATPTPEEENDPPSGPSQLTLF